MGFSSRPLPVAQAILPVPQAKPHSNSTCLPLSRFRSVALPSSSVGVGLRLRRKTSHFASAFHSRFNLGVTRPTPNSVIPSGDARAFFLHREARTVRPGRLRGDGARRSRGICSCLLLLPFAFAFCFLPFAVAVHLKFNSNFKFYICDRLFSISEAVRFRLVGHAFRRDIKTALCLSTACAGSPAQPVVGCAAIRTSFHKLFPQPPVATAATGLQQEAV